MARVQVHRGADEISLPKLSFELLIALLESAPSVATTDYLLQRVRPGLMVNAETVTQRVRLLRSALGDDPKQPRYISVVRGHGYQMIPAVSLTQPVDMQTPAAAVSRPPDNPRCLLPAQMALSFPSRF